jgi:hypothetical protein
MTLPSGRSPVPDRLDITESEFALHIDNLFAGAVRRDR